jgi:hypothetical protein
LEGDAPRFGFRFHKCLSFAPPYGGQVGAPGGHALPTSAAILRTPHFLFDGSTSHLLSARRLLDYAHPFS